MPKKLQKMKNETYLKTILGIIYQSFPLLQKLHLLQEQDPETDEKYLLIDILVAGEIDDILNSYDVYIKKFVAAVPASARKNIRLSYNII